MNAVDSMGDESCLHVDDADELLAALTATV